MGDHKGRPYNAACKNEKTKFALPGLEFASASVEAAPAMEPATLAPAAEPPRRADPSRSRPETTNLGSGSAGDAACVGTTLDRKDGGRGPDYGNSY